MSNYINVNIPAELHKKLKIEAAERGITMTKLINEVILPVVLGEKTYQEWSTKENLERVAIDLKKEKGGEFHPVPKPGKKK